MHPKEVFWIGAKGGLCEEKHYRCMRDSVWLFLWLLMRQTGVNEAGEGIVNYGNPFTRVEIQEDTGYHERRLENWIDLLRRTAYIRTESKGNKGLTFFIKNAKSKSKNGAVRKPVENSDNGESKAKHESPNKGMWENGESLKKGTPIPSVGDAETANHLQNQCDTQNATTLNTKSLSYYNKAAAATAAAGSSPSVEQIARDKQIPRTGISDQEARDRAKKQQQDLAEWLKQHPEVRNANPV